MSAVGSGGLNFVPLVGATAGLAGQRRVAEAETQQAEAAERKFQLDRGHALERSVGDIGASDEAGERDADGRQPWGPPTRPRASGNGGAASPEVRRPDVDGERGGSLDLDA